MTDRKRSQLPDDYQFGDARDMNRPPQPTAEYQAFIDKVFDAYYGMQKRLRDVASVKGEHG